MLELRSDFLQKEVIAEYEVSKEIKKMWFTELDLIQKLQEVCKKHHIEFFMAGGTLLGSVRHKGFIPWDVDADFIMTRANFEKLKSVANEEFREPFFLQTIENEREIFLGGFARLRHGGTTHITPIHINRKANLGIWIDISVFDYLHEDQIKREKQIHKIRFFQRLMFAKVYKEKDVFIEISKSEWNDYKFYAEFVSREWISSQLHEALTESGETNLLACFTYHADRYYPLEFNLEDFNRSVILPFENLELPAPNGYKNYLEIQYGANYMEYPPLQERRPHLGIMSSDIPYTKFLRDVNTIVRFSECKNVIIFGAGQMLQYYLGNIQYKRPVYIVDNDELKWGTEVQGILVKSPHCLLEEGYKDKVILICSIHYRSIVEQLKSMSISEYAIFVQNQYWL